MAKKKRQRISYVLPLASSPGGHRLGVNGLVLDEDKSILYSGGRDGVICAWDVDLDKNYTTGSENGSNVSVSSKFCRTAFRRQVQAHTHWVNDIILAQNNSALVSASSDVAVKVWRPHGTDANQANTIGLHTDYVKCLAIPDANSSWVASGGLDHKIYVWDLNGAGQNLEIDIGKVDGVTKGSVYALHAKGSILASGGPESVARIWDTKSGKGITKLVGHTDNIRDILMSDDGTMLLTASSDQTVKVWSMTAGRCMHTLTMHNDSVWAMYSNDPRLAIFYSSDRSGLVAKTDTRHAAEIDEGVSVAVCQEHDGVSDMVVCGDDVWTATSSSSVNRWEDVNTELDIETPPRTPKYERSNSSLSNMARDSTSSEALSTSITNGNHSDRSDSRLPFTSILRLAITSPFPVRKYQELPTDKTPSVRKASEAILDHDLGIIVPVRGLPMETIEGQNGLIKHVMLNDRKRVLTLDTAGEIVLWDLLKCTPIRSFGRKHLEDVVPEVNTLESVANWCTVDTRSGKLSVTLEENYCFDAEVYADEIEIPEKVEFREDQRINLGKWVLRNLFATLLDEEIRRDDAYRKSLRPGANWPQSLQRLNAPGSITLPDSTLQSSSMISPGISTTPRASEGSRFPMTPGMSIGLATPGQVISTSAGQMGVPLSPTAEEGASLSRRTSKRSQAPPLTVTTDRTINDYFNSSATTAANNDRSETSSESTKALPPVTPSEAPLSATAIPTSPVTSPVEDKEEKKKGSLFGKKFQMTFPKNLGRKSVEVKQAAAPSEEKTEELSDKSSEKEEKILEDNFHGVIQRIRHEYNGQLEANREQGLTMGITPSLPNETPVLKPPPHTLIIIQEDNPESGGLADLYRGEISQLGQEADIVEKIAPMWLGDLLLKNQIPYKDTAKVSFVLQPYQDLLPSIASPDGNARLNANRMLRSKKILGYISERIEEPETDGMKPEEYLELLCHDQVVHPNMTLSTLRVHVWRTGGDVLLYYRANGKKQMKRPHPAQSKPPEQEVSEGAQEGAATTQQ